jgi:RNA polymerase sigma-70 factor (sigma-E family)
MDEAGELVPSEDPDAPASLYAVDQRQALEDLFRAEYASLVRLATLLLGDVGAAEEVVQEAFVRLDGAWHRLKEPSAALPYLRSIVLNLARSRLRHHRVARSGEVDDCPSPPADEAVLLHDDQREVIAAVRTLSHRQQEVVILRYWQNLSEAEIAAALGISRGAVKSHAHRAMAALAEKLEADDD